MTTLHSTSTQGFIAVSRRTATDAAPDLPAALAAIGVREPEVAQRGTTSTATWGFEGRGFGSSGPLLLCRNARRRDRELKSHDLRRLLVTDQVELTEVNPTFAAVDLIDGETIVVAADALGFRHLYLGRGTSFAVVSTSARAVSACLGTGLDREAIAVQSLLGWQVGQRTLFERVEKLAPGHLVTLEAGRIATSRFQRPLDRYEGEIETAVTDAARVLRGFVESFLDDYPDIAVQLTGGQDSRLILSAIPPTRRPAVRALTLVAPGSPDGQIAARLAQRCGMDHEVLSLDGLEALSPEEADLLCVAAARQLECMADPLAHAVLAFAEARAFGGARLGGFGGEVARGFYSNFGPLTSAPVTRRRVEQLMRWRMFPNESVSATTLDADFAGWARDFTVGEVFELIAATGLPWMAATDDFYFSQRMQRWAGIVDSAVCFDRVAYDPMLDDRFVAIARALSPGDKRNARFLGRLQVALDEDLARVPLDGRPAPVAYASRGAGNVARRCLSTTRKAGHKIRQRAARSNRPPAGGAILAAKVAEHWRRNPDVLSSAREAGIFDEVWIEGILAGDGDPAPSAVALLTNLRVATERSAP